jgi:hypothetical protein
MFPTMKEVSSDFYPYSAPPEEVGAYILRRLADLSILSRTSREYGKRLVLTMQANSLFPELEMDLPRTELEQLKDYTFERTVDETDDEILKWNGGIYAIRSTVRWGGNRYRSKREELNVIRLWRKKP